MVVYQCCCLLLLSMLLLLWWNFTVGSSASFIFSSLTSGIVVGLQVGGFGAVGWIYFVAFWFMWEVCPRKEELTPHGGSFAAALFRWRQSGIVIGLGLDWRFVKSGQWCTMSWIFKSLKWFLSLYLKLTHYQIGVFRFLTLDVNVNAVTAAEMAPPGVAGRKSSRRARLGRGAAQREPFCNKPPVKLQVYYEMVWAPACWRRGRWRGSGLFWKVGVCVLGLIRGHFPGFACNNFYFFLLDKAADGFKMCTSFTKPRGL